VSSAHSTRSIKIKNRAETALSRAALFFVLAIVLASASVSANPSGNQCGSLDGNFTLNASVTTTTTCFTIAASDVTLDCNGYTITYKTTAGATAYYGVYDSGYDGLTVKNCTITAGTTGGASHGIYLYNGADNANITNSAINAWTGVGVYVFLDSNGASIDNSRITSTGLYGVYVYDSDSARITNNPLITATASTAIYLKHGLSNTLIENNTITTGAASGTYGILATDEIDYATVRNNSVYARTMAFYLGTNSDYAIVANNNLTSRTDNGVYLISYAANSVFENNTIASGTSADNGVYMAGSCTNNSFTNNTISSTGGSAVYATTYSSNALFYNNTLASTAYGFNIATTCLGWNVTQNIVTTTKTALYLSGTGNNNWVIDSNNFTTTGGVAVSVIAASSNANITNSNITASTYGVNLVSTSGFRFENNTIRSTASYGAYLSDAESNQFINNTIISGSGAVYGLALLASSDDNLFYNNTINGTANAAVFIQSSVRNKFYYNNINGIANAAGGVVVTTGSNANEFYYNNVTKFGAAATTPAFSIINSNSNLVANCTIDGGTYVGLLLTGTSQYNVVTNTTVYTNQTGGDQALYLNTASSNNFTNSNFTSYASQGVYLCNYAQFNYFENVNVSSRTSYGVYLLISATSNSFNATTVVSNTSNAVRLSTTASSNIFRRVNLTAMTSYAVYLAVNSDNNTFDAGVLSSVYNSSVYSTGSSDSNKFYNLNVSAGTSTRDYGFELYTNADSTQVVNTTITASGDNDLRLNGDTDIYFLNVTFSEFDVTFVDALSSLNLSWFARIRTMSGGNAIEEATALVKDSNGATVYSGLTHASGYSDYFPVTEYVRVSVGGLTYYTPHNFTASMDPAGGSTSQSVSDNADVTVQLDADACGTISMDTVLRNNVYAGGTCFTIVTSGVTLDCNGYAINYSRRSTGYGISVTGENNAVIKNCTILQDELNSTSHAVFFSNADGNAVYNSTITVRDAKSFYLAADADDYAVSTVFNKSNAQYADALSSLNVSWYFSPSVTDLSGNPIENARLTVYDSLSNLKLNETTDAAGLASTNAFTEYVESSAGKAYYTSYLVNTSKGGVSNSTSVNLTADASAAVQLNASTCRTLSSSAVLTNDVEASGTCFTIAANGVTLDCAGYAINYSRSTAGYAVNATGYTSARIANCRIIQGSAGADSHAIHAENANNALVANTTVSTDGAYDYYFAGSHDGALINSTYEDSRVFMDASSSNLSVYWPVNVIVIGLASEAVPNAPVVIRNLAGSEVFSGLTGAAGTAYAELRGWVKENAGITNETPHNFTVTHPETNYETSQNATVDSTKNVTVTVVSASVNVSSPADGAIYFQGQTVPIYVNETKGETWITNVTVSVFGDGIELEHQATEETPGYWLYSYNIDPAMTSRVLTVHARGYNGTTYVQDNTTIVVTRATGGGIEPPAISHLCPNNTYVVTGSNTTINATADLDTVIYTMVVNVTYPDASSAVLPAIASSADSVYYIYSYLYEFNATQTGAYVINATARDVNDQWASSTQSLYAVASADAVAFTGSGITNYQVTDVCSHAAILEGAGEINGSLPAGKYDLVAETASPRITLYNASLNSTVSGVTLAYESVAAATPPTNRRNVALFGIASELVGYESVQVYYNYTAVVASLVAEASLEMQKCASADNCTWTPVAYVLDVAGDVIYGSSNSLSVWGVFEPAYTEPQNNTEYVYIDKIITNTSTTTVIKEVYVPVETVKEVLVPTEVPKYVSISILQGMGAIEMHPEDSRTAEVKLKNNEAFALEGISLAVETDTPGVTASFASADAITLAPGEEKTVSLSLRSQNQAEGNYTAKIRAAIASKNVEDAVDAPIRVMRYLTLEKEQAQETINFARQLLEENTECAELSGNIEAAQRQLDEGEVGSAADRGSKVIGACKSALMLLAEQKTGSITGLAVAGTAEGEGWFNNFVFTSVGIIITLTASFVYSMYKKKRENAAA